MMPYLGISKVIIYETHGIWKRQTTTRDAQGNLWRLWQWMWSTIWAKTRQTSLL